MDKLDATEADIAKMTNEIEKAQEVIDRVDKTPTSTPTPGIDKGEKEKGFEAQEAKAATEEESDEEEEIKLETKKVNVKVTNFSPAKLTGLQVI